MTQLLEVLMTVSLLIQVTFIIAALGVIYRFRESVKSIWREFVAAYAEAKEEIDTEEAIKKLLA